MCVFFGEMVMIIRMLGLSLERYWHGRLMQRYEYSHVGIVFNGGYLGGCAMSLGA